MYNLKTTNFTLQLTNLGMEEQADKSMQRSTKHVYVHIEVWIL